MKKNNTYGNYLVHSRFSYCFRMKVPADLQQYIDRKELRYSLKTGYLGIAKFRVLYIAGILKQLFR